VTIAIRIHHSVRQLGAPWLASRTAVSVNGRAKIECSHLIISNVVRVLRPGPLHAAPSSSVKERHPHSTGAGEGACTVHMNRN